MTESREVTPTPTHDDAIERLCKSLINSIAIDSEKTHGDTPRERLQNHIKHATDERMVGAIAAFSTYLHAKAADRQATALETIASTASQQARTEIVSTDAQAIVDQRESKRDYLATTYSLPTETLSLLWAVRGMLVDASIKSLSRPDRFDPYRRLTTEEVAWSLRMSTNDLIRRLPRTADDTIDFDLLEEFDIMHYSTDPGGAPDDWMFGG